MGITGYRKLSDTEIELINKIKEHNLATEALLGRVNSFLNSQYDATKDYVSLEEEETQDGDGDIPTGFKLTDKAAAEQARIFRADPYRWVNTAKTDFQKASMALVRAVAQPTDF